ncbi:MAG: SAM-dependent methyltransferase [Sphingobacteriales bacterium]|jgi:SAM-dependent methyltransferase
MENVNCAVCESNNTEKINSVGQFGIAANVVICKNCGLSYLNPRWSDAEYLNFYTKKYDKYYRPNPVKISAENNPTSYYPITRRLKESFGDEIKFKNILDIGSGDGSQLMSFIDQNLGENYFAIEPSEGHKNRLNQKGIKFISNNINSDWNSDYENKFDFVIMRHVFEHMLDLDKVLDKVKNVLTDNGIIYIAVPDAYNPFLPLTSNFFRAVHTYYFSKTTLTNILNKNSLHSEYMTEGDSFHPKELFCFVRKSKINLEPVISDESYSKQLSVYSSHLMNERKLGFQINQFFTNKVIQPIVRIKKHFFPKAILKKN